MAGSRPAPVFCSFEGCDELATGSLGVSAFCLLHLSSMLALLDSGAPEVQTTPTTAEQPADGRNPTDSR